MRKTFYCLVLFLLTTFSFGQTIKRIDGTTASADSIQLKIEYLMKAANVSGVALSIFNNNQPVYTKTFGFADIPNKVLLRTNTEMYAASFAKTVFAYIVMQFVQEKTIDLDKPLVEYLPKDLTNYKISGWKRGYQDLKGDDRYKKSQLVCALRIQLVSQTGVGLKRIIN